jgi:hypothetical protein
VGVRFAVDQGARARARSAEGRQTSGEAPQRSDRSAAGPEDDATQRQQTSSE